MLTLLTFLRPAAALLFLLLSALVFGSALIGRRVEFMNQGERTLIAIVLGWGMIAQGLFILGMLGGLNRFWTFGALLLAHLACFRAWRRLFADARALLEQVRRSKRWLLGTSIALVILLPSFLLAHYPPTGFDATVYHLPYVKTFLEAERLVFVEDLRFPIFPQVGEMGFVLAFLLEGETTAKLTQWLACLLIAGLLLVWRGDRGGRWAAALWLGTPLVIWISVQAYIDHSLALFVTTSIYAWDRWRVSRNSGWIVLAGTFAGLAAGTKYLALFWLAIRGGLALHDAFHERRWRPLLLLVIAVLAMMGPWYARLMVTTGNPVFPFYAPLFGASEWTSSHDRSLVKASSDTTGLEALAPVAQTQFEKLTSGLEFLLLLPWNAVFERQHFHHQAPLTPFYLLLIPLSLPLALANQHARVVLLGVLLYALFWLTTVRDLRFLLPALPIFHLVLTSGLDRLLERFLESNRPWKGIVWGLAILFLIPGWAYAIYKLAERGAIPTTQAEREDYLLENVSGYAAIQTLNQKHGSEFSAYALFGEHLHYHALGRLQGDWFGPANYWRILAALDQEWLLEHRLRELDVCELILVDGPRPVNMPAPEDPDRPLFRLVQSWNDAALYQRVGCQEH